MSHFFKADKKRGRASIIAPTSKTQTMLRKVKINTLRLKNSRKVPCVKRKVRCGMVTICVSMIYGGVFFSVINISI